MLNKSLKFFSLLLLTQLLIACGGTPKKATEFVFYPPPPTSPKIQYLTSFSGADDLIEKTSGFSDFILGDEAMATSRVRKAYGVAIKDGIIYLVDIRGAGFATFDLKKNEFNQVRGTFDGRMVKPINIFVDDKSHRYITDMKRKLVVVFDEKNQFVRTIGEDDNLRPSDVLVVDERVFVSDINHNVIQVYNKDTGEKLFNIQEFTLEGEFIRTIGKVGNRVGNLTRPKGIDIDKDGNIYVVDASFSNVQIFNKQAEILMYFGQAGGYPHNINLPAKVVIDYDNISYFQKYAKPGFEIEHLILVTSQFGRSMLNVYGFGHMQDEKEAVTPNEVTPDEITSDEVKPDVVNQ